MYDFLDLKLIRYMSEESSLSAVAARARMSLPAVSQRLTKLEEELKEKLVFRAGPFGLTNAGKTFLKSAIAISNELENLERQLRLQGARQATQLRILASTPRLIDDLPALLDRLLISEPGLLISIREAPIPNITAQLLSGDADLALVPPMMGAAGLELHPYRADRACIIAPLTHPLSQKAGPIFLKEALMYDFIGLTDDGGLSHLIDAGARDANASVRYRIRVSSEEAQAILVGQTHQGIALTHESVGRRHSRSQPISVIRLADDWAPLTSQVYLRGISYLPESGQKLVAMLQDRFADTIQSQDKKTT